MSQFDAGKITIQSGDSIGYSFKFPIASTSTANDGCVPYGRTISTVDVTAYDEDGDDVTTDLISGTPGLGGRAQLVDINLHSYLLLIMLGRKK